MTRGNQEVGRKEVVNGDGDVHRNTVVLRGRERLVRGTVVGFETQAPVISNERIGSDKNSLPPNHFTGLINYTT